MSGDHDTEMLRRLVVIQGAQSACYAAVFNGIENIQGDWIFITDNRHIISGLSPKKSKSLLGHEYLHAVFDATLGFHLEAFAILAGTLKKGSLLLLLLPEQPLIQPDMDSLRWYESEFPIATPNFIHHLLNTLAKHQIPIYSVNSNFSLCQYIHIDHEYRQYQIEQVPLEQYRPTPEQAHILAKLNLTNKEIAIITAKRGRGKSALAGLFSHSHDCWICVPNKESVSTLKFFAAPNTLFWAPDHLLTALDQIEARPEWMIIDEAAMIPIPILKQIMTKSRRVLLITTTEGYEGTGQGFLLKLLPELKDAAVFHLVQPIRWQRNDPLEQLISDLLLEEPQQSPSTVNNIEKHSLNLQLVDPKVLAHHREKFHAVYGLLKLAHYRTTPVDLRRLFDANNMSIVEALLAQQTVGVILAIKEGELTADLSHQIWLGNRRPRGNLVAQSLVAHAGEKQAATLRSLRINRLAVSPVFRLQGIGRALVEHQLDAAKRAGYDFVSVSFAYNEEISAFWQSCGFLLVHIGSHQEASSGCYAAMAINALSTAGNQLQQRLVNKLSRNWFWLRSIINLPLPIQIDNNHSLTDDDWQALAGFAFAHRPYEVSYPAICRLKHALPVLLADQSDNVLLRLLSGLTAALKVIASCSVGRKIGIQQLRQEIQSIFNQLNQPITL